MHAQWNDHAFLGQQSVAVIEREVQAAFKEVYNVHVCMEFCHLELKLYKWL